MPTTSPPPAHAGERLDLHNASVEESAAAAGHCGMTDLRTGRVCQEPHHHAGGCASVAPSAGGSLPPPHPLRSRATRLCRVARPARMLHQARSVCRPRTPDKPQR
ncbi:MAG: hypothetical protein JWO98_708 [Frankiales bacterium]|nr:hypothetical protein [Frankiales bacterium]